MLKYYFHCSDGYDLIVDREGRELRESDLLWTALDAAARLMPLDAPFRPLLIPSGRVRRPPETCRSRSRYLSSDALSVLHNVEVAFVEVSMLLRFLRVYILLCGYRTATGLSSLFTRHFLSPLKW